MYYFLLLILLYNMIYIKDYLNIYYHYLYRKICGLIYFVIAVIYKIIIAYYVTIIVYTIIKT